MNEGRVLTKQSLEIKLKVMLEKIEQLNNIFQILNNLQVEKQTLMSIKQQYLKMYNEMIEREEHNKYFEIEELIVKGLSKLELRLEEYVYDTISECEEIILSKVEDIRKSENYQNFNNLDIKLENVRAIKELIKLYSAYISQSKIEKLEEAVMKLKFEILYRKQVEELIYRNGGISSNLIGYENKQEKEIFKKMLKEKINTLKTLSDNKNVKNDKVLNMSVDQILHDCNLLERIIILDMRDNPLNYINLLKVGIFNAHICNIGDNPFEPEIYINKEELYNLGFFNQKQLENKDFEGLKADKVNYSLLKAVLKNIITDENISIIECENLYRKFGFKCSPILLTRGQQCIKMIFDSLNQSKECNLIENELIKSKKKQEPQYCKIFFYGINYNFLEEEENVDDLLQQILGKRETTEPPIDLDGIVLLLKDAVIQNCEENIEDINVALTWLESLKHKQLTLEEMKQLLAIIKSTYIKLKINEDKRKVIPLEYIEIPNTDQEYLVEIPEEKRIEKVEVCHIYMRGWKYEDRYCYRSDLRPLWKKYQKEFKELGIDIKEYNEKYNQRYPVFYICINLDDISDLPIDYNKVQLLTKEELQEIIDREKENER